MNYFKGDIIYARLETSPTNPQVTYAEVTSNHPIKFQKDVNYKLFLVSSSLDCENYVPFLLNLAELNNAIIVSDKKFNELSINF